jgi:hypothetical protein
LIARRDPVDLTTLLTVAVAVVIASSRYFLFFGLPQVRQDERRVRRTSRR